MRTKINIFLTILRQECAGEAPQYGRLLSPYAGDAPQKEKILRPECGAEAPTFLSAVYKRGTQAKKRQAYAPQYGRLLSLCTGDAPQVSNAVYNQRYTSEKVASRSKQSGRSMIEMLGVLAIIGVLTVGSIAGYSHAMRRHLLNKQREQISYILNAVETHREMLDTSPNSTLPFDLKPIFETLGWIPEEMIRDNSNYIYDVFKNKIYIYFHTKTYQMIIAVYLDKNHAYEQCVNLYQMTARYHSILWFIDVFRRNSSSNGEYVNVQSGDQHCTGSQNCLKDLKLDKITELCHACDDLDTCRFLIRWNPSSR